MFKNIKNILFWSVISAAFIGPGTVTVAAKAGASYQLSLLWALSFSIIATIVLQEGAARLTICSGNTLGHTLAKKFGSEKWKAWVVFVSVALGCAAYEAGNILGAVSGALLLYSGIKEILVALIGILAFLILRTGNIKIITNALGLIVALMGLAFFVVAINSSVSFADVLTNSVIPQFPSNSSLLIIGLVGTTVVPYNLFLGSGISKGQELIEMRSGLFFAVAIGGLISVAVLVVGSGINGEFSFEALVMQFESTLGNWSSLLIGIGLLTAGFTSCVTAPLATAITGQSIFGQSSHWKTTGKNFRLAWLVVLITGLTFGITDIKPIPVIILAQAVNGILLPFVAIVLWLVLNDKKAMSSKFMNSIWLNVLTGLVVFVSIFLGMNNLTRAIISAIGTGSIDNLLSYIFIASLLITFLISYFVYKERN